MALATLVARCRSSVMRDGYTREIEVVPGPEGPARIIKELDQLRKGLEAIGVERDGALTILLKAGLDSVPLARRQVFEALKTAPSGVLTVTEITQALPYSPTKVRRQLEELSAHGLAVNHRPGASDGGHWGLSPWTREKLKVLESFPEVSAVVHTETPEGAAFRPRVLANTSPN